MLGSRAELHQREEGSMDVMLIYILVVFRELALQLCVLFECGVELNLNCFYLFLHSRVLLLAFFKGVYHFVYFLLHDRCFLLKLVYFAVHLGKLFLLLVDREVFLE